jgi:hypothetical protein
MNSKMREQNNVNRYIVKEPAFCKGTNTSKEHKKTQLFRLFQIKYKLAFQQSKLSISMPKDGWQSILA